MAVTRNNDSNNAISTDELPGYGPVIPVITIHRADDAVPLASALVAGGVRVLEITLRSEVALDAMARIARDVPDAIVGAGTITRGEHVHQCLDAGARFGVSPGLTHELAGHCQQAGLPLLPGVSTASEIMMASAAGYRFLKLFPAVAVGGLSLLRALHGPFESVRFCPTGGINPDNAQQFLSLPNVLCVGGSWLTPDALVRAGDWDGITRLAREAGTLRNGTA